MFGDRSDYSGFDLEYFRLRYGMAHKMRGDMINKATTITEKCKMEKDIYLKI